VKRNRRGTPPELAPSITPYVRAWLARRAVEEWRAADRNLRAAPAGPSREAHERAVALALAALRRFSSVEALVEHARVDHHRRATDPGPPPIDSVEGWLDLAARAAGLDRPADLGLVAGAALWRRVVELLGERPE